MELAGDCTEARELTKRVEVASIENLSSERIGRYCAGLGIDLHAPQSILKTLASWGEPAEADELALMAECEPNDVARVLRWADLLGLTKREGGNLWSLDPLVNTVVQQLPD